MTDETLPELWALDMAAKAVGHKAYASWKAAKTNALSDGKMSIIAHARTLEQLAKHDPSIMPVDEDLRIAREICARVAQAHLWEGTAARYRAGQEDRSWTMGFTLAMLKRDPEALAAFRKEKGL